MTKKISISEHFQTQGSPLRNFRYCEKKNLPETRGIRPSLNQFFFVSKSFRKHRRSQWHSNAVLWDKKFWWKSIIPSFNAESFPIPQKFWKIEGFHDDVFRHCKVENFPRKIVIPSIYAKSFSIPQVFWDIEGFPATFSGTVRLKMFDWKSW